MVSLADVIAVLRPNAVPLADYTVRNDGAGDYIASWTYGQAQPTPTEIAAVTQAQVDAARRAKAVNAAVNITFTGLEPSQVSDRVTLQYLATSINNTREAIALLADGHPASALAILTGATPASRREDVRLLQPAIVAGLLAAVAAGAGDPVTP